MWQGEGIGEVFVSGAFQDPQDQRGQVRAYSDPPAHGAQKFPQAAAHLAATQLAAQRGVLDIQQLPAHSRQEMIVAHQVRDCFELAARDGLRTRAAQIANGGDRRPESIV